MSVDDEVRVVWKTKCKWRDHEHVAKRQDVRPNGISVKENFSTLPLKPGDAIKIRFGNKWYHGEMLESWNPLPELINRAEKGIFFTMFTVC